MLFLSRYFSIIDIIVFQPFTLFLNIALINIQYVNHSTLSPNIRYFISHFAYSCIKLSGMQSSTFTVNIFRHSALSTCNKYTSQKNSHKNLNFPKFCCLFVCTLTMQCLSLLHYTYRESQSVYKTVLYKFFFSQNV